MPENKIKLKAGELYLAENGLKIFVAKIFKQKAFCSIEGYPLTFIYSISGKASIRLLQKKAPDMISSKKFYSHRIKNEKNIL